MWASPWRSGPPPSSGQTPTLPTGLPPAPHPFRRPVAAGPSSALTWRFGCACIVAWIIALALVEALVAFVGNEAATEPLLAWHRHGFGCVVLWFILGPFWSLFLVRRGVG